MFSESILLFPVVLRITTSMNILDGKVPFLKMKIEKITSKRRKGVLFLDLLEICILFVTLDLTIAK
jgi:hypothetical protein